jgi:hypothetical protein
VVTNGVSSQWDPRISVRTHPLNKRSRARAQSYVIRISYLRAMQHIFSFSAISGALQLSSTLATPAPRGNGAPGKLCDFDAAWDPRSLMMDAEHTADEYRDRAAVWSRVGPPATCHCLIMKICGGTDLAALSRTGGGMDLAALGRTDCTTLRPPPTPPPTPPAPRARVAAIATAGAAATIDPPTLLHPPGDI